MTTSSKKADLKNAVGSDASDNYYVANIYLVIFAMQLVNFILVETGLFYVPVLPMRILTLLVTLITAAAQIFGRVPSLSSKKITKYIIILLTLGMTIAGMCTMHFHAVLSLAIPLAVAINYRSSGISALTIAGSAVCALLAPVLGVAFKTWDTGFFSFLSWCVTGEGISSNKAVAIATTLGPEKSALFFVGFPQLGYALIFGIAILFSSRRKTRILEEQIRTLRNSRDALIEGMSGIVENRDISTGGHIRRTRGIVDILVNNMRDDENYKDSYDESYWEHVVMAASTHDLGKISVPDAILNKPGKLDKEEFECIKTHPEKGREMVHSIMKSIDDEKLREISENIAMYHHEKYDGNGYPKGLKGSDIPLEARIMAIADVYDALVSERCYKAPMSQTDAYDEILRSMGTHFDPALQDCFIKSYPQIVKYYEETQETT